VCSLKLFHAVKLALRVLRLVVGPTVLRWPDLPEHDLVVVWPKHFRILADLRRRYDKPGGVFEANDLHVEEAHGVRKRVCKFTGRHVSTDKDALRVSVVSSFKFKHYN
jgi:hypothetical protein